MFLTIDGEGIKNMHFLRHAPVFHVSGDVSGELVQMFRFSCIQCIW